MNFRNKVTDCVISHYSGSFRGNTREIGVKYQVFGKSARRKFIWDSKVHAAELGKVFVFDRKLGTFIVSDEDNNSRVASSLTDGYKQNRSVRLHMKTLYDNGDISKDVYDLFFSQEDARLELINNV